MNINTRCFKVFQNWNRSWLHQHVIFNLIFKHPEKRKTSSSHTNYGVNPVNNKNSTTTSMLQTLVVMILQNLVGITWYNGMFLTNKHKRSRLSKSVPNTHPFRWFQRRRTVLHLATAILQLQPLLLKPQRKFVWRCPKPIIGSVGPLLTFVVSRWYITHA